MYWNNEKDADFEDLKGLTIKEIRGMEGDSEDIHFVTECGRKFKMYHSQNCCESVYIESVVGDVSDLIGTPIVFAEASSKDDPENSELGMWTFYKLATVKGWIDIRWYGSSNGYYSVGVDFVEDVSPTAVND